MSDTTCKRRPHSVWTTCLCPPCTTDRNRRLKRVRIYGPPPRVSSDAAWAAVDIMLARRYHAAAISDVSGIPLLTVENALKNRLRPIGYTWGPRYSAALVAATPKRPTKGSILGIGSTRRLRALAVTAWSVLDLQEITRTHRTTLSYVKAGKGNGLIRAVNAGKIAEAYEELGDRRGPSPVTATLAIRAGWPAPADWYDLDIDDPDARPSGTGREEAA